MRFFLVALLVGDIPQVEPEKLPRVKPVDVPALLAPPPPEEPGPAEKPSEKEEPPLPRNKFSLSGVLSNQPSIRNVYRLISERFVRKELVDRGEPFDLAPFLQKSGFRRFIFETDIVDSGNPPTRWLASSMTEGRGGPFQIRMGMLVSRQGNPGASDHFTMAGDGGAAIYLGRYLKLGYLYSYIHDMDDIQNIIDPAYYTSSESHAADAALLVRLGRQYFLIEGKAESGTFDGIISPDRWEALLTWYLSTGFSLMGEYSEEKGTPGYGYGAGFSAYLGKKFGLSLMWTSTVEAPDESFFDTRIFFRF